MDCNICSCEIDNTEITFTCGNNHSFHEDCLGHYVNTNQTITQTLLKHYIRNGTLPCPCDNNCSGCITKESIKLVTNKELLMGFVTIFSNLAVEASRIEIQSSMMKEGKEYDFSAQIFNEVVDVLSSSIKCPHCKQVFFDFEGCLALTCASCQKMFCGFCLEGKHDDSHDCVLEHFTELSSEEKDYYGLHSNYFATASGWVKIREYLQTESIVKHLKTYKFNIVCPVIHQILNRMLVMKLITAEQSEDIKHQFFSHEMGGMHLVRIPTTYWMLYSTRKDMKIEDVMRTVPISTNMKIELGKVVLQAVKDTYPGFMPVRDKVPGETFEAVNYPPFMIGVIALAIKKWCDRHGWDAV